MSWQGVMAWGIVVLLCAAGQCRHTTVAAGWSNSSVGRCQGLLRGACTVSVSSRPQANSFNQGVFVTFLVI